MKNSVIDPWLYYFEPVSSVGVRECRFMHKVIYSRIRFPRYKGIYYYREKEKNILPDKARIHELYELTQKYMKFRPELQEKLENTSQILTRFQKVLGIHVRGTDMFTAGKQHPVPNGKTKDFAVIDEIMEKHKVDGIFLCTDTESTVRSFKEHYGEKIETLTVVRQENDEKTGIHRDESLGKGRVNHKYLLGEEVLTDMYLLSKCDVLLCGPSNVAFAAMIYNDGKYEEVYYQV